MRNPNWIKKPGPVIGHREAHPVLLRQDNPGRVTEAELEALRYRGIPIHRAVSSAQPLPPAGPGRANPDIPSAEMHNDRAGPPNEAERQPFAWVQPLRREMSRALVGQPKLVDRVLVGLVTGGHLLLESASGCAPAPSLEALAGATRLTFRKLQLTPDLLPTDVIGTIIYNLREGSFRTERGPIFNHLVLAEEIDRASTRVRNALLEAMESHQVNLGGELCAVPQPFLVVATQRPPSPGGVPPLTEAQADHFMLKVLVDYPDRVEERALLDAPTGSEPGTLAQPVVSAADILAARSAVSAIHLDDALKDYIVDLVWATRDPRRYGLEVNRYVRNGASPRATVALSLAARASAFLNGRDRVTAPDVRAFAPDALRHRLGVSREADADQVGAEHLIRRLLEVLPAP